MKPECDLLPILETAYTSKQVPFKFFSDARAILTWSYYYSNNFESAIPLFKTAIELHPD